VEERLDLLEAGLAGLQAEAARVKGLEPGISREAVQLKTEMASLKGEVARLQAALPLLQAEMAPLKAEVAGLKAEMAQLRARVTPSDLPWWMGGRKK
jgi:chromosome segregation ATPase